jgi:pimeloyl-ACP methyl ester carboxylesterase
MLASELSGHRRVIAPSLFGYGGTSAWDGPAAQRVADQAALVGAVLDGVDGPVDLVGHSFGALVALEVAARLGPRAGRMVLYEPNAFALLDRPDCAEEYREVLAFHRHMQASALTGDWPAIAARFTDYFSGDGAWEAMPAERRAAVTGAVVPNPHEWDAAMDPALCSAAWLERAPPALLVWARDTRAPLRAVVRVLLAAHPDWTAHEMERGGHLGPILRARAFNALASGFLKDPGN